MDLKVVLSIESEGIFFSNKCWHLAHSSRKMFEILQELVADFIFCHHGGRYEF